MTTDSPITLHPGEKKLLVSACLMGNPVRYDGQARLLQDARLDTLLQEGRIIAFCPEVAGGLPVPRAPAEIQFGDGADVIAGRATVRTNNGEDLGACFRAGAEQALALCLQHQIDTALLTERSPSCGSSEIYDGSFKREILEGHGVTTALLEANNIRVFNQNQVDKVIRRLSTGS